MTILSAQIQEFLTHGSWIRKMFETGMILKNKYGTKNVFDFSIGNPDVPCPPETKQALQEILNKSNQPFQFGYMPNAGFPETRTAVARCVSKEQEVQVPFENIIMTNGAAGGMNVFFKSILNPGDEVICLAPYFVEYSFYIQNNQGVFIPTATKPKTFEIDICAIEAKITNKTKAIIINSPNNPSGQIYSQESLINLSNLLIEKNKTNKNPIFILADEPYRFLSYGKQLPSIFKIYPYSVIANSYSKSLSLAGERIGYLAVNPNLPEQKNLIDALILATRILGFVNAPTIGQQLITKLLPIEVDKSIYEKRKTNMAKVLGEAGAIFNMPQGGFYFFPEVPKNFTELNWINTLQEEKILAVPGSGFGVSGYYRLSFSVDNETILAAAAGFKRAYKQTEI